MKRARLLLIASLFAASCSMRPVSNQLVAPTGDLKQGIEQNRIYSAQSVTSKFAHRGVPDNRYIDDCSSSELAEAKPNQLSIVVKDRSKLKHVAHQIAKLGYGVRFGIVDNLVVDLPDSGEFALKKHFKILDKLSDIAYVSPRFRLTACATTPMDPDFSSVEGWPMRNINAPEAWDYPDIRNPGFTIAIVDTGVRSTHEDLRGKVVPGINSGPTSSVYLADKILSYSPSYSSFTDDLHGHGTHVAALAAANTNNYMGIASPGWGTRIMPIAVGDTPGMNDFYSDNTRAGVIWAIDHGIRVLNLSLSSRSPNPHHREMVRYAVSKGAILVCSAGNNSSTVGYPAAYSNEQNPEYALENLSNSVLAVGSVDKNNIVSLFSNTGPAIDLTAPGSEEDDSYEGTGLLSASFQTDNGYTKMNGTSMAAPIVAGALSSLWYASRALPLGVVVNTLQTSASDSGLPGKDSSYGYGILNFGAAADYLLDSGQLYDFIDSNGRHAYTNTPTNNLGTYQRIVFALGHVWGETGTRPLYSLMSPTGGVRRLLVDWDKDYFVSLGWTVENFGWPIGHLSPYSGGGSTGQFTVRLIELQNPSNGRYAYAIAGSPYATTLNQQGYTTEVRTFGYASPV